MKTNNGKGNIKEQKKRRRKRLRNATPTTKSYECIDGNFSFYPIAYCKYHKGALTQGLMDTHKCKQRECKGLKEGVVFE